MKQNSKILPPPPKVDGHILPLDVVIPRLFDSPKIIGLTGDVSSAKSNFLYAIIDNLINKYGFSHSNLYTYALPVFVGETKIYSVEELEQIENSVIILDEFYLFLDLENRKQKKNLGEMMQRIKHSNNVLILSGLPHNFNKFVSSQCEVKIYKQTTLKNLINGSPMKDTALAYSGIEKASTVLFIPHNRALVYGVNGHGDPKEKNHWTVTSVDHMTQYDVKLSLPPILPEPIK